MNSLKRPPLPHYWI